MVFAQDGARGSVADLFVRGGDSKYNLVLLNGVPINSFYYGGLFDFAQIPSDFIEEIDVARGPQSAIYGSYAIGSVVNFVTRSPENGPALDLVAEGGTHEENRVCAERRNDAFAQAGALPGRSPACSATVRCATAITATTTVFLSARAPLAHAEVCSSSAISIPTKSANRALTARIRWDFSGLDLISRSKNNTSTYGLHYQNDFTDNLRVDLIGGIF